MAKDTMIKVKTQAINRKKMYDKVLIPDKVLCRVRNSNIKKKKKPTGISQKQCRW